MENPTLSSDWQPSDLSPLFRQKRIDIGDGISLCTEIAGDPNDPPLLLITGLGSQMNFWSDEFINHLLAQGLCVIRFDNRDTGLSTKIHINGLPRLNPIKMMAKMQLGLSNRALPVAYNLADMAEDTARLAKHLMGEFGFDKIALLGASMGGIIAQITAARYPNYIQSLVLLFSTTNKPLSPLSRPKQFLTFLRRPQSHSERDIVRHSVWFMTAVGTPGHLDIKGTRDIAKQRYNRNFHPLGVTQQINAILATGSILRHTKRIKAPTLILHGTKDGLIPMSHGKFLAKNIENSHFVAIDGMGHDLPSYYHAHLADLIANHLKRHFA